MYDTFSPAGVRSENVSVFSAVARSCSVTLSDAQDAERSAVRSAEEIRNLPFIVVGIWFG